MSGLSFPIWQDRRRHFVGIIAGMGVVLDDRDYDERVIALTKSLSPDRGPEQSHLKPVGDSSTALTRAADFHEDGKGDH